MKTFFDKIYLLSRKKCSIKLDRNFIFSRRGKLKRSNNIKIILSVTQNNLFLSLQKMEPKKLVTSFSSGRFGFKNKLRKSKKALLYLLLTLKKTTSNLDYKEILVFCKGQHWLKTTLFKFIHSHLVEQSGNLKRLAGLSSQLRLFSLKSSLPFNGCRKPKKKT